MDKETLPCGQKRQPVRTGRAAGDRGSVAVPADKGYGPSSRSFNLRNVFANDGRC